MVMPHQLTCHDDIHQPYARVRDALLANPGYVFRHATAAAKAETAALRIALGPIDVGVDVALQVLSVARDAMPGEPLTKLTLGWTAARAPALFPVMWTTLSIFPLANGDTRIALDGTYQEPLGRAGQAIDAVVGHRIADASVSRFVKEVAGWLREELAVPATAPAPDAANLDPETERAAPELEC